jgi:hypothetical protein
MRVFHRSGKRIVDPVLPGQLLIDDRPHQRPLMTEPPHHAQAMHEIWVYHENERLKKTIRKDASGMDANESIAVLAQSPGFHPYPRSLHETITSIERRIYCGPDRRTCTCMVSEPGG